MKGNVLHILDHRFNGQKLIVQTSNSDGTETGSMLLMGNFGVFLCRLHHRHSRSVECEQSWRPGNCSKHVVGHFNEDMCMLIELQNLVLKDR